jgi:hypothetical protein
MIAATIKGGTIGDGSDEYHFNTDGDQGIDAGSIN